MPSYKSKAWATIELRRYLEYARLSLNWSKLEGDLFDLLAQYDLELANIDVFDYEDVEEDADE